MTQLTSVEDIGRETIRSVNELENPYVRGTMEKVQLSLAPYIFAEFRTEKIDLPPTLPFYLAYLYHVERMSLEEVAMRVTTESSYHRDLRDQDIGLWMRHLEIPIRSQQEAMCIRGEPAEPSSQLRIGFNYLEGRVLLDAILGYTTEETAERLGYCPGRISNYRRRICLALRTFNTRKGTLRTSISKAAILILEKAQLTKSLMDKICIKYNIGFAAGLENAISQLEDMYLPAELLGQQSVFSPGEAVTLLYGARGYSIEETAAELGVTEIYVAQQRSGMIQMTGARSFMQLIVAGYLVGLYNRDLYKKQCQEYLDKKRISLEDVLHERLSIALRRLPHEFNPFDAHTPSYTYD
ncbi:hypothetical protein JW930_04255 [Candidatus Woesearchaeota archaeon]|nr:hypothetical protein [Candidatus Woesearchaeota archaeon]